MTTLLDEHRQILRHFDPWKVEDLHELDYFLTKHRWKTTCPFVPDYPYLDVVSSCLWAVARNHLGEIIKELDHD